MSIWGDPEIVKVDGEYKAYVKIQNDWRCWRVSERHPYGQGWQILLQSRWQKVRRYQAKRKIHKAGTGY